MNNESRTLFVFEGVDQEVHTVGPAPDRAESITATIRFSVEHDRALHSGGSASVRQPGRAVPPQEFVERSSLRMPATLPRQVRPRHLAFCQAAEHFYRMFFGPQGRFVRIDEGTSDVFLSGNVVDAIQRYELPLARGQADSG